MLAAGTGSLIADFVGLATFIAVGFGLSALPFLLTGAIGLAFALVVAIVVGVIAFVATMTWQVIQPVVVYAVVPAAVFTFDIACRASRLAISIALLWALVRATLWLVP